MPLLLFVMLFFLSAPTAQAEDACPQPFEAGKWENIRQEVGNLTTVEIIYQCEPHPVYGQWKVRAKAKCHPRDCTWGWVKGRMQEEEMRATFQTFNHTHHVYLFPFGQRYRAEVETIPRSDIREPSKSTYIMIKVFD